MERTSSFILPSPLTATLPLPTVDAQSDARTSSNYPEPMDASSLITEIIVPSRLLPTTEEEEAHHEGRDPEATCWVCLEDESDAKERIWIRACRCRGSLKYAHEACLLDFIESKSSALSDKVKCPACGYFYIIHQRGGLLLRLLEFGDKTLRGLIPYVTIAGLGLGTYIVCLSHGIWSLSCMLGPSQSLDDFLGRPWSWRVFFGLSSIPISLGGMCFRAFDNVLPLIPFAVFGYQIIAQAQPFGHIPDVAYQLHWPPSYSTTLCLLPWVRVAYLSMKRWTFQFVTRVFRSTGGISIALPGASTAPGGGGGGNRVGGAGEVAVEQVADETEESIIGSRSTQMLFVGALMLPGLASEFSQLLALTPLRRFLPSDILYRNLLSAAGLILGKDLVYAIYGVQRKRAKRFRRLVPYHPDLDPLTFAI